MTSSLLPQCSDPQVICYVADQCSSAVQLDEEQLLRAADRCVQLGSPAAAFELCLTDRRRADSKAREVARLLDEDAAPEVVFNNLQEGNILTLGNQVQGINI